MKTPPQPPSDPPTDPPAERDASSGPETGSHEPTWAEVDQHLQELFELPEDQWEEHLREIGRTNVAMERALRDAVANETQGPPAELKEHFDGLLEEAMGQIPAAKGEAGDRQPGEVFGPYKIEGLLGRGGMGEVYAALRIDGQYEQQVALKIVRRSSDGRHEERFRYERQVLANLEHANIARLLDGGVSAEGTPYIAMERVTGRPLTTYCDEERLSLDQRLALFKQILAAVGYAHRNMVIHRDIKPSNVMVSDDGEIKLLDFGIAKILSTDGDQATQTRQHLMTPEYAAPEQIRSETPTAATDVYSLGVLLFELLSGVRPFVQGDSTPLNFQLAVLENDAPKLTAAVTGQKEDPLGRTLRNRRTTLRQLERSLGGELEAIVAKCLRKEPESRYPNIAQLQADLDRHLTGLPVLAVRGSSRYVAKKFLRRHWAPLAATAIVFLSLAAGLVFATLKEREARRSEAKAAAINRFLTDELLAAAKPEISLGEELSVKQVVAQAEISLAAFRDQPEVAFGLRRTLASIFRSLGDFEGAQRNIVAADALSSSATPLERARLEFERAELGSADKAIQPMKAALRTMARHLDPTEEELTRAEIRLGMKLWESGLISEAEVHLAQVSEQTEREVPGSVVHAAALTSLALILQEQTKRSEALVLYERALRIEEQELGANHPQIATTLRSMVGLLSYLNRHPEAMAVAKRALAIREEVLPENHPLTLDALYGVVLSHSRAGNDAGVAESAAQLALRAQNLPSTHRFRIKVEAVQAWAARRSGDRSLEAEHYKEAVRHTRDIYGPLHENHLMHMRNLTWALEGAGRSTEALDVIRSIAGLAQEALTAGNEEAMFYADQSAFFSRSAPEAGRDLELARQLAQKSVELAGGTLYYPLTALADVHYRLGEMDLAIEAQGTAMRMDDALGIAGEQRWYVDLLAKNGRFEEALEHCHDLATRLADTRPEGDPIFSYVSLLEAGVELFRGYPERAEELARRAGEDLRQKTELQHDWNLRAKMILGQALLAQDRTEEARRELQAVADAQPDSKSIRETTQELIEALEAGDG